VRRKVSDVCWSRVPGKPIPTKGGPVYIGIGTLVFILLVVLIIWLVRRA
jgi:hypothetical protein